MRTINEYKLDWKIEDCETEVLMPKNAQILSARVLVVGGVGSSFSVRLKLQTITDCRDPIVKRKFRLFMLEMPLPEGTLRDFEYATSATYCLGSKFLTIHIFAERGSNGRKD